MTRIKMDGQTMTAVLMGEIDHHTAKQMRETIDQAVQTSLPVKLYLDFGEVTFMDSSGIGLIMGRYQNMKEIGGTVFVQNASASLLRVMRLAGLERLVRFE